MLVFIFVLVYVIVPSNGHNEFTTEACLEAHNSLRSQHTNTQPVTLSDELNQQASIYARRYALIDTTVDVRPPLTLPKRRKRSASEHIVSEKLENPFRHRQKRHVSDVNPDIHLELWDGDITYPDGSWNRLVNGVRVGESIHKFCCLSKPHCPKEFLNNLLFPPSANGVVNDWYAQEINNYDFDTGTKVIDNVQVKHFSNIVWRNTTEIGCAQAVDSSGRCIYTIALYKLEGSIGTPEEFKSNIGGVVAAESDSNNNFILIIFLAVLFVALLIGLVVLCYCCRDRLRDKYMKIKIKTDTMKAEQELETDSTRFWWLRICRDKKVKRRRTTVTRPKTFSIKERPTIEVVPNSPPARSRPSIPRARGQSNAADFLIRYQGIGQKAENYVPYRDQPLPTAPKDPNTSKRPLPTAPTHSETVPLKPKQPLTKLPSLPKENDAASGTKRPVHRTSSSGKPPPPPVPQSVSQSPSNFQQPQTPKFSQPINPPPRPVKSLPPPPAAVLPPKPVKNSPKTPLRPISVPATQNKPKPIPRKNTAPIFPPEPAKSSPPTKPKPPTVSTGGTEDNNAPKSVAELRNFLEKR